MCIRDRSKEIRDCPNQGHRLNALSPFLRCFLPHTQHFVLCAFNVKRGPVSIQERNQKVGSPLLQNLYCYDKAGTSGRMDYLNGGKSGGRKILNIGILSKKITLLVQWNNSPEMLELAFELSVLHHSVLFWAVFFSVSVKTARIEIQCRGSFSQGSQD